MKFTLKSTWQIMHKPLIVCCIFPFALTLVSTILCIVSPRPDIRANPYSIPLFCWTISLFICFFMYFIFVSIRITFDGQKLTCCKFFLPVKSFSTREIKIVIYNSQSKFLIINNFTFPARLYPQERIDELLEILSQRHGIQTSKI